MPKGGPNTSGITLMRNIRSIPRRFAMRAPSSQDDHGLMGADGDCRNDWHLRPQSQANEPEAIAEPNPVPLPPGPEDVVVAAWVVDQYPPALQDRFGLGPPGLDCARSLHDRTHTGKRQEEGVEQRVHRLVFASLAPPRGQQDRKVRWHLAARVVAHHEKRSSRRKPLESSDL